MSGRSVHIGRLLIALAMIVQIFAPVGSSAAMMRMTFDPLVDIIVCAQDQVTLDRRTTVDPVVVRQGDACGLCQLVAAGGIAPPPAIALPPMPTPAGRIVQWRLDVEAVVAPRLLDHIRGRAPPALS